MFYSPCKVAQWISGEGMCMVMWWKTMSVKCFCNKQPYKCSQVWTIVIMFCERTHIHSHSHHSHSSKKVLWNDVIIIIKSNLKKMSTSKRLAKTCFNFSVAVWFYCSRLYRKKDNVVASQHAQLVRESKSFIVKANKNLLITILWQNTPNAEWVM